MIKKAYIFLIPLKIPLLPIFKTNLTFIFLIMKKKTFQTFSLVYVEHDTFF